MAAWRLVSCSAIGWRLVSCSGIGWRLVSSSAISWRLATVDCPPIGRHVGVYPGAVDTCGSEDAIDTRLKNKIILKIFFLIFGLKHFDEQKVAVFMGIFDCKY